MSYQVFYKNYLGQWVADRKTFTDPKKAETRSKSVAKKSENGKVTIQKVK